MSDNDKTRKEVIGYLMRAGWIRSEERAAKAAEDIILTVRYPYLQWDLDWDHETEAHRSIRTTWFPSKGDDR